MEDKIVVKNVSKMFGKEKVLDNVSLTVKKGSIVGIVGRNGSGKTVLFKLICGFYSVSDGEIIVDGKKLTKSHSTPENIGSIIETPGFLGSYSGYRNLKFLADIRNRIGKKEICEAIEMVGLDNQGVADMRKLFLKLKEQGRTMLVASHNREDIDVLCDEVYEMDHGILTTERK